MNRSLFVSLASVTLALFVGGCAADFDGQEPGTEQDTNASLEGNAGARYESEGPTQNVEGVADIQDPRVAAGEDLAKRAAGHEPLLVKMQQGGGIDPQTNVDGH